MFAVYPYLAPQYVHACPFPFRQCTLFRIREEFLGIFYTTPSCFRGSTVSAGCAKHDLSVVSNLKTARLLFFITAHRVAE